jgi:hypothetical protein
MGGPYLMMFWHHSAWQGIVVGSLLLLVVITVAVWRLGSAQRHSLSAPPQLAKAHH